MPQETIRALAAEIANQTILGNWLFYIVLSCITVVLSALGAYLSTYFSKRAERAAIKADFGELKRQLRETTSVTESIKVDIQQLADRTEKLQWLKRQKLEDYVVAILRGAEYISQDAHHRLFDDSVPLGEDPLITASMLQRLYLPELDHVHLPFIRTVGEFRAWIAAGMAHRLEAIRTGKGKLPPPQEHMDLHSGHLRALYARVLDVEFAARDLGRDLNKV